ncbi:MAG: amidase [Betaproteobacteria bacterium]|nr:amidase [Betaproteobacteria bacterium]
MDTLNKLSATEAAAAIAAGKLKSEPLVAACIERIRQRENDVQAWAHINPELALMQSRECDRQQPRTRLHGIPVGVKDVIDTADMPTEYGSPIYRDNQPKCDAACVAQVRDLGGVVLGKTVSTEFATRHPGKTCNPRNLAHTPGGSSSGSAAAVADCMVPLAFGTQTTSSIIRPAAYCGVVGYKPTFNVINRAGLKFLSDSLDTIGVLARTVPDAALIVEELSGSPATSFDVVPDLKPRIGFCRTPYWHQADRATQKALERAVPRLQQSGARVTEVELDGEFARLVEVQVTISSFEIYRALGYERTRFPDLISETLMGRILGGGRVTRAQYEEAHAVARRCRARLDDTYRDYDALLAPSAIGEAPKGLASTGDPVFGSSWTVLHGPAVTVPAFTGPGGLPLGAQLAGPRGHDSRTLLCAEWVRRALAE